MTTTLKSFTSSNPDDYIMKEFTKFQHLFVPHDVKTLKKYESALEKEALQWYKDNFKAVFGSTTSNQDVKFTWHWSVGMLMFGIKGLGDYHYKYVIMMIHFEHWKNNEWRTGFAFGRKVEKENITLKESPLRDANPYSEETNFYNHYAWDAGYMMGLYNLSFIDNKKKNKL